MKTILSKQFRILAFGLLLFFIQIANAQSPIIKEFRNILIDAPNKFESYKVAKISDNKDKNYELYSSKIEELPFSVTRVIAKTNDEPSVYFIKYDVKNLDAMMLKLFINISTQYMTEINDMVKSGNYTGRDVKDNGDDITEVFDLKGNHVMDYISNADAHFIYVYSRTN